MLPGVAPYLEFDFLGGPGLSEQPGCLLFLDHGYVGEMYISDPHLGYLELEMMLRRVHFLLWD